MESCRSCTWDREEQIRWRQVSKTQLCHHGDENYHQMHLQFHIHHQIQAVFPSSAPEDPTNSESLPPLLVDIFTFLLSPVLFSKWYFVVTKSHYSNDFINIYGEVWGRRVEVFCFHLSACCNYTTDNWMWLNFELTDHIDQSNVLPKCPLLLKRH